MSETAEDRIRELIDEAEDFDPLDLRLARLPRNDIGNAERMLARHGRDLMHVKDVGWFAWNGQRWSLPDGERIAQIRAQQTARAMRREAWAYRDAEIGEWERLRDEGEPVEKPAELVKRLEGPFKWTVESGNRRRLTAMIAEAAPHLGQTVEDLDADPMVLNVQNGTLHFDRSDGGAEVVLRPHARDDRLTNICPVAYDPAATCPSWRAFLDLVMPDRATQAFLQRWYGYCLTGLTGEECLVIQWGEGSNGKSTLVEAVGWLLGDYSATLAISSLLQDDRRRGSEANPDIARLPGARLVAAGEPGHNARFDESLIKTLTGGDRMIARYLNREFFDFQPTFKIVISTNPRPQVRGQDEGIWRRLVLVPFEQKLGGRHKDQVMAEFRAEGAGILNWALDGLRLYLESGLGVPDKVRDATADYRADSDAVGRFLREATRVEHSGLTRARTMFEAYERWCAANAERAMSANAFGRAMTERGYRREKVGVMSYVDVLLVDDFRDEDGATDPADRGAPPPF